MADDLQTSNNQTPEPEVPPTFPAVRDKRKLPEGVVPKQAQGYVVAGLAVLILMAVMFSKNHPRPASKESTSTASGVVATDANQQRIRELEQDLTADQRQSQKQTATP